MKAQLGRPTGLALALLSTLLATFFAMGVFAVAQANEHSATRSFSATTVAPGTEITVSIALSEYGEGGSIAETLPEGFGFVSGSIQFVGGGGFARPSGNMVNVVLAGAGITNVTYKVTAPSAAGGPHEFSGNFVDFGGDSEAIGGESEVTVSATPVEPPAPADILSSQEPGAAVRIEIEANAGVNVPPGEDINIKLKSFSLPDTISESHVLFSDGGGAADSYVGNPSEARISGSDTIILTVPSTLPNGNANPKGVTGSYKVVIKQSAGIANPTAGGKYTIEVDDADDDVEKPEVQIDRVIKLSKTSGTRGTMTTATFKGFANGSATVNLNGDKLADVVITNNTGTLEIDTTSSKFEANRDGGNEITAQDAAGNDEDVSGKFTISPKVVLDPAETSVSKMVNVKLSDWPANNGITEVKIGATTSNPTTSQSTDGEGKVNFMVLVPSGVNRGTQTVKVTGTEVGDSTPSASASLKVGVLSLSAQPAMVVPGQQITIQGSGFVADDSFSSVMVGGISVPISPAVRASSAGDIVITVNVPSPEGNAIGSGKKSIVATATGSNRVAEGSIEIPKASIALDPGTSRRGTTVNVSGSGFPSGDLVQVKYENNNNTVTVAAGSADASGAVSIDFVVPSYARIGTKHEVEATSVGVYAGITAKATHETPGAMVSLSTDSIASGQSITVSGMNFPAFATVAVMEIGGVDVRPVPAPATSIDGDFESTVLVPQLELGNQTVSVRVSSTTVTDFLEISTTTVSRAPSDVFANMTSAGRLERVWYLVGATQMWEFYDPDPDLADFNNLDEITVGEAYILIVTAGDPIEFQGRTLYAGTNNIPIR